MIALSRKSLQKLFDIVGRIATLCSQLSDTLSSMADTEPYTEADIEAIVNELDDAPD
ncbi:MAG: hypothetical protein K2H98_09410 [Duncaniella sp.]|nr:hypothetical protein [Duncaniella sp.]